MRQTLTVAICILIMGGALTAATLEVPQIHPTIQGAIEASQDGDVIRIQPGVYSENINFLGKAITVTGTAPDDWDVVAATMIQGGSATSAVVFDHNETTASVLTGLTITGSGGVELPGQEGQVEYWGLGICCIAASPTIRACIIQDCEKETSSGSRRGSQSSSNRILGGGIGSLVASPLIEGNVIKANKALFGAGILTVEGEPLVRNNWIYMNSAQAGGGLLLLSGNIVNNTVVLNEASDAGANLLVVSNQGTLSISHNIFSHGRRNGGVFWDSAYQDSVPFTHNNVWENQGGDYLNMPNLTGAKGNISVDPQFVDLAGYDLRIKEDSLCIDAGSRLYDAHAQRDIVGGARHMGETVDLGAFEYQVCRNLARAGNDQYFSRPQPVTLNGSESFFCDPDQKRYTWEQVGGPTVELSDVHAVKPEFTPVQYAEYAFELVVSDGMHPSPADYVRVVVENHAPVADAGARQSTRELPVNIQLDGSGSLDQEGDPLAYYWQQLDGPMVELADANTATPSFVALEEGDYLFSLVVFDGVVASEASHVEIIVGNVLPIADAGKNIYIIEGDVTLDGRASYDPETMDGESLLYQWAQVSGDPLSIADANSEQLQVTGLSKSSQLKRYTFELVVDDGQHASEPALVDLVVVRDPGQQQMTLLNPPFNPNKPTMVGFSGGNCDTGGAFNFGSSPLWRQNANLFNIAYRPPYDFYADYLIQFLSEHAPDYSQPIQTMGHSTGGMPSMEVAKRLNTVYGDPRYTVQRVVLLDAGCGWIYNYPEAIKTLRTQSLTGQPFWVENYYSNAPYLNNTLNIRFPVPPANHGTPPQWYRESVNPNWWPEGMYNDGIMGGYYFSVAGPGKNMQVINDPTPYYYQWVSGSRQYLEPFNMETHPGRLPEPVSLDLLPGNDNYEGVVLSCDVSRNAVTYELLMNDELTPLDEFDVVWSGDHPPEYALETLPYDVTWWTVRVRDALGSTHHEDPRSLTSSGLNWPVTNANTGVRYVSIQDAIDQANTHDHILIAPGQYAEILVIQEKRVTLEAQDGNDTVVLTGSRHQPVIIVDGANASDSHLIGLTLTNGSVGVFSNTSHLNLSHCRIIGNHGAGIDREVVGFLSMQSCTVQGNLGHGIDMPPLDRGQLSHCLLVDNAGHGAYAPQKGTPGGGRGGRRDISAAYANLTIDQCTLAGNAEYGLSIPKATITNSICYFNMGGGIKTDYPDNVEVTYSNIQGTWPGTGILDVDPLFVSLDCDKDYHLQSQNGHWDTIQGNWMSDAQTSPCIDAGDPSAEVGLEPQPNGNQVNMGAYGGTDEASLSDG